MRPEIMDKALSRVSDDVSRLIEENREKIKTAMREQMIAKAEEDPDAKLSFGLSFGANIEPSADGAVVTVNVSWSVKTKKSTDSFVTDEPELDLGGTSVTVASGGSSVTIDSKQAANIFKRAKK